MLKKSLAAILIILLMISEVITLLIVGTRPFEQHPIWTQLYRPNTQTTNRWPLFPVTDGYWWGYVNSDGESIIAPQFLFAYDFDDTERVAKVCLEHKRDNRSIRAQNRENPFRPRWVYALIDEGGKIIEASENVGMPGYESKLDFLLWIGPWGESVYNKTGEVVLTLEKGQQINGPFEDGIAVIENKENKKGIINIKGERITPCLYDGIDDFGDDGIARVTLDGQFGYINRAGEMIVPIQYAEALTYFQGGFGWVQATKGGAYSLVNTRGEVVFSGYYENVEPFSEGLAAVKLNGKYGFTDSQGNLVVPARYDWVKPFKEGMAIVAVENQVGYVNKQGVEVVPPQYTEVKEFSMGLAAVQKNGRYSFINETGAQAFEGDYAQTGSFVEDMVWVQESEKGPYGYVNRQGELVYPCQFEAAEDFHNGLARVNCKADLSGNLVKFYEGTVHLKYIDKKGAIIWPKNSFN